MNVSGLPLCSFSLHYERISPKQANYFARSLRLEFNDDLAINLETGRCVKT